MAPIPNWKKAHRLWSVQAAALNAVLSGFYAAWPAFQDHISFGWFVSGSVALSVATLALRLVPQPGWDE